MGFGKMEGQARLFFLGGGNDAGCSLQTFTKPLLFSGLSVWGFVVDRVIFLTLQIVELEPRHGSLVMKAVKWGARSQNQVI